MKERLRMKDRPRMKDRHRLKDRHGVKDRHTVKGRHRVKNRHGVKGCVARSVFNKKGVTIPEITLYSWGQSKIQKSDDF